MPCAALAAPAADQPVDLRIADDRITESSGLALSGAHPHTVWTVNDSGDSARAFAVDTESGMTVGVHTFDAPVRDVEALAITPQGRMLVADIGDNDSARPVVRLFWFDEPELGNTSGTWASWELTYPDGPHNAEAIAVDPRSGRVLVVTKERPGGIYALPAAPSRQGVNRLTKVATAPDIVTDAVFLDDGSGLAVRTYTSLAVLDPETWHTKSYQVLPLQPQGETLAVAPGGKDLLAGSEGLHSLIQRVTIVGQGASSIPSTAPGPSGSSGQPSASASGLATATGNSPSTGDDDTGVLEANRGELISGLGACAGLVALAYVVARLARRRRR
jgi:hypothetical protein